MNNIQSIILSGLQDVLTILVGFLVAYIVAFVKQHFSARQIATATWIATDSVNFAVQAAKKLGLTQDLAKYNVALGKAKELAVKAGLRFTDSQWETLIESAYKKAKSELHPIQEIASTTPAMTQDDIFNMIQAEVQKMAPGVPADAIESMVEPLIDKALSNLSVSVNVASVVQAAQGPASTPVQDTSQPQLSAEAPTVQAAQPDPQAQAQTSTQQPA